MDGLEDRRSSAGRRVAVRDEEEMHRVVDLDDAMRRSSLEDARTIFEEFARQCIREITEYPAYVNTLSIIYPLSAAPPAPSDESAMGRQCTQEFYRLPPHVWLHFYCLFAFRFC